MSAVVRKAALFVVALVLVAVVWELYKLVGPERGGTIFGRDWIPKSGDLSMPHVSDIVGQLFDPENRNSDRRVVQNVLSASWYSLRLAFAAFVVGTVVGVGLAMAMSRFDFFRRAALPYLIISQTVPLIALAPIVSGWSGRLKPFGMDLPRWWTVVLLGAFLAFFPVAIGTLRGLQSTPATAAELLKSYAAPWRKTLWSLQLPAAIPYMVPAFRLAASASVVGVVVSEISTGRGGGIGRLVVVYAQQGTAAPAKVFSAVFGACLVGLVMAGLVASADSLLMRNRARTEDS